MKLNSKMICAAVIIAGLSLPSLAAPAQSVKTSAPAQNNVLVQKLPMKVGVVDVKKVVSSSKEVQKVKKEQQANKKILVDYIKSSAEKINKAPTDAKKAELKKQFTTELTAKKEAMDKVYSEKLLKINNDMNVQLGKLAKDKQFDIILTQDAVLYGGDDLTKDLMKMVK